MIDPQRRRVLAGLGATCASAVLPTLFPSVARAATWPGHAVTFIVPFPAGGPVDTTARFTTQPLGQMWSVPTVVDNKSGAGGIVGAQFAAKAAPDGYNFFFASIHHAVLPSLRNNLTYDITTDFVPVGMAAVFPIVLVVNASVPVNTVSELIAYAKKNPGKLSFGSSGTGGGTHLAGELFNAMAGTRIQHVPYRGSAPAMTDLIGNQIPLSIDTLVAGLPQIKAGKVRAVALTGGERSSLVPDVPTVAEGGVAGYDFQTWFGVVMPKGTPEPVVTKMSKEIQAVMAEPDTRARLQELGFDATYQDPAAFRAKVQSELERNVAIIKAAGIKPD